MPLDPSIPLGVRPPAFNNPFERLAKIRAQQQEEQIRRQQIESNQATITAQQRQVQGQQALDAAYRDAPVETPKLTRDFIVGRLKTTAPHMIPGVNKDFDELDEAANRRKVLMAQAQNAEHEYLKRVAMTVKANDYDPTSFEAMLQHAESVFDDFQPYAKQLREQANGDPESIKRIVTGLLGPQSPVELNANTRLVDPTSGKVLAEGPKTGGANVGSFEDYVVRSFGPNPTPAQIETARKAYGQADDRASVTVQMGSDDTEAIADAIISGDQPPTLQGLYRNGAAVRAALAKKGFGLAQAETDWRATQKHVATLNGAQQTRMAQAIDNASHSLDVIDQLADQWNGGKFPILNKGILKVAKNGGLGPQAQQIATNLEAQISDVTSELGNVYMGGNSPTDHALTLAGKNLSADWTKAQLKAALDLARKNLQIRANSMRNVGVAGASATNPYAAPPPAATPAPAVSAVEEWIRDESGKLVKKGAK